MFQRFFVLLAVVIFNQVAYAQDAQALPIVPKPQVQATVSTQSISVVTGTTATAALVSSVWQIKASDRYLSVTFERWAKLAGYRLVYDATQEIRHSTIDEYKGSLTDALKHVLSSPAIARGGYPLEACIYPNSPPVLRVTRAGEQLDDCQ